MLCRWYAQNSVNAIDLSLSRAYYVHVSVCLCMFFVRVFMQLTRYNNHFGSHVLYLFNFCFVFFLFLLQSFYIVGYRCRHRHWLIRVLATSISSAFPMKEVNNDIQPSTSTFTDENRPIKNEELNKRKRRASDAAESNLSAKRFVAPADEDDDIFKLLDFTDEVLLEILHNCDSTTLYALSKWVS